MTTGKTATLTVFVSMLAFVGKVMSLLFHMLSRFVKAFLLRSKHLLIPWLVERELILWSLPIKAVIPS